MKKREKQNKAKPVVLFFVLIFMALGVYAETQYGLISDAFNRSQKRLAPEGIKLEYGREENPSFSRGKDGFLCVTNDGAVFYSFKAEELWRVTFTMQSPFVIKNGENWAILEPKGRTVYVCGRNGFLYTVNSEFPILSASMNSIQCLTLLLERNEGYAIRIHNNKGEETITRKFEIEGVYPVCTALSDDGYIFCVSLLDTTRTSITSILQYFYTDSGAKRYGTDSQEPFKAIEKPNSIVTNINFSSNGNLTAIADNEIFISSSKGEEVLTRELHNRLESLSFGDKSFGCVLGRPFANARESAPPGLAEWFDYDGKPLTAFPQEGSESVGSIEQITIYDDFVLLKSIDGYILTDINGRGIWTYGASEDIVAIIPIDKKRAIIAKNGSAEIYSLKKPKGGGEDL